MADLVQRRILSRAFALKKACLTLVEILIVIAIFSLVGGFIGININKAVREQRFRTEVSGIVDLLRTAQDIMLMMDISTKVLFTQDPSIDGIQVGLETDTPLPKRWSALLQRPPRTLKGIHWVQFEDVEKKGGEGKLTISFLSSGVGMSKGILRLSTSARDDELGALTSWICLPGYPKPIFSVNSDDGDPTCKFEDEEEYVKNITRQMYEEIRTLPDYNREEQKDQEEEKNTDAA